MGNAKLWLLPISTGGWYLECRAVVGTVSKDVAGICGSTGADNINPSEDACH